MTTDKVTISSGRGDLPTATLTHDGGASCEVVLSGAHITSWKTPDGVERLFVSSASGFGRGIAIRGGIPVCFPQFSGRGPLSKHGFARTSTEWEIAEMSSDADMTRLVLSLRNSEASRAVWPHSFELRYSVTLTGDSLAMDMHLSNTGDDVLDFTAALHTYFAVPDVGSIRIHGLSGLSYEDNAAAGAISREEAEEVAIVGEVDRVYLDAPEQVKLLIPTQGTVKIAKSGGFRDVVVWNLGEQKAPEMADLGEGEWRHYVCIEAGAIGEKVTVAPGECFAASQRFDMAS